MLRTKSRDEPESVVLATAMNSPVEQKAVTIHEVARALGVAKSTISRALNGSPEVSDQMRQAVLSTALELGFKPNPTARKLANRSLDDTVCLISQHMDFPSGAQKLQMIQQTLQEEGHNAPIYIRGPHSSGQDVDHVDFVGNLCRQKPRAIVFNTATVKADMLVELAQFRQRGGTVVCYDFAIDGEFDSVVFDREYSAYTATCHLLELGHRDIGFCFYKVSDHPCWYGFERAMKEYGIPIRDEWKYPVLGTELGGAELAATFLRQSHRPTAVCVISGMAATAFVAQLYRNGLRIPDDLSIVTNDGQPLELYCSPVPLTTVTHSIFEIAHSVVALLKESLADPSPQTTRRKLVRGDLITRDSTSPR